MIKALWTVPAVAILGTASAVAVIVASPGGEEEVVQQPSPTATSGTATPTPAGSPTVSPDPSSTPDAVPADWQTYDDPVLRFSLRYPPDLVLEDLTPSPGTGGAYIRVVDFRSPTDASRAVSVEVLSNTGGLRPQDWALAKTACQPETIEQTTIAGAPAVSCTEDAAGPHPLIVLEHMGRIYEIGLVLSSTELDLLLKSLRP